MTAPEPKSTILDMEPEGQDKNKGESYGENVCSKDESGSTLKRKADTYSSSKEKTSVSRRRCFKFGNFDTILTVIANREIILRVQVLISNRLYGAWVGTAILVEFIFDQFDVPLSAATKILGINIE